MTLVCGPPGIASVLWLLHYAALPLLGIVTYMCAVAMRSTGLGRGRWAVLVRRSSLVCLHKGSLLSGLSPHSAPCSGVSSEEEDELPDVSLAHTTHFTERFS